MKKGLALLFEAFKVLPLSDNRTLEPLNTRHPMKHENTAMIVSRRSRAWLAVDVGGGRGRHVWITGHKKAFKRRVRQSMRDRGFC